MKNPLQHSFRRTISFIVWGIVILVTLPFIIRYISIFIPPYSLSESNAELERIRTELPLAEARWKSHNITDYDIDASAIVYEQFCYPPSMDTSPPWHLSIRQGELIFDDIQKDYVESCWINDFLPPKVFETIRRKIETIEPEEYYMKIEFDTEYGYVSEFLLTTNSRVLSGKTQYSFSNFRPKKP